MPVRVVLHTLLVSLVLMVTPSGCGFIRSSAQATMPSRPGPERRHLTRTEGRGSRGKACRYKSACAAAMPGSAPGYRVAGRRGCSRDFDLRSEAGRTLLFRIRRAARQLHHVAPPDDDPMGRIRSPTEVSPLPAGRSPPCKAPSGMAGQRRRPQVLITLEKSGRSYPAFGASGLNARINFGETDLRWRRRRASRRVS
jgi:hypothetical protein